MSSNPPTSIQAIKMPMLNKFLSKSIMNDRAKDIFIALLGSFFVAFCSQFSLTLPFISMVPFSLQPHAVLLLAAALGSRRGSMAMMIYLFEGACGFPVFAHGYGSLMVLLGPRGGYLFSYLPVVYIVGKCFDRCLTDHLYSRLGYLLLGNVIILSIGGAWLACFIGFQQGYLLGILPFIMTDLFKTIVLSVSLPFLQKCSGEKSG